MKEEQTDELSSFLSQLWNKIDLLERKIGSIELILKTHSIRIDKLENKTPEK